MTNEAQKTAPEKAPKAGALIVPVSPFQQNCTLLWCEATKRAVVVDPGGDVPQILAAIKQADVTVDQIWITHGHIDHVGGAAELRDALKVPIEGPHPRRQIPARPCRGERRELRHGRRAQLRA